MSQVNFGRCLDLALDRLFDYLEVSRDDQSSHRVYDREVIEVSPEVSLVLVLPPPQSVCFLKPSSSSSSTKNCCSIDVGRNDLLAVPLHSFEFMHLNAYNKSLLANFCRSVHYFPFYGQTGEM